MTVEKKEGYGKDSQIDMTVSHERNRGNEIIFGHYSGKKIKNGSRKEKK